MSSGEVIHVPLMANRDMTAAGTVHVRIAVSSLCHAVSPNDCGLYAGYLHNRQTNRLFRGRDATLAAPKPSIYLLAAR
jgi:hypothetical protein